MKITSKNIILALSLLFSAQLLFAQPNRQAELEQQRQRILQEISQINQLLRNTRQQERSVLTEVETIAARIQARENLIRVTNQQANLLTREINTNQSRIDQLRNELEALKKDYANLIVQTYKSRSNQSRLMFLLSSENFLQAYKRVRYMQQYADFRKQQGEEIQTRTLELQELNQGLIAQQQQKQALIEENRKARNQLIEERKQQEQLMATLRRNEAQYTSQIRQRQQEADEIDRQIQALIRAAIAEANRAAGTTARERESSTFVMTPEARALANNFARNKGRLPWPVERGNVVTRFGTSRHPTLPNITINSSGVEIATQEGAKARATFDGEVLAIMVIRGNNRAVQIRHGDYITVYQNIDEVYVQQGDKVTTRQEIGRVFTNPNTGRTVLKFLIFQNTNLLNPSEWIYQMN